MTDSKSWLWRKKSSEKTIVAAEKVGVETRDNGEEFHVLLAEKAQLERDVHELGDKLSSAFTECNAKDEVAKKHAKTAKEALAGWEKAEAKAMSLKQDLDEALKERDICEERTRHLDAALKECMQQLHFVREDQEQRIHSVLLKASEELEETKMFLEEKLEESGQEIAKLTTENSQLGELLLLKEQLIGDLNQQIVKTEADVHALLTRIEHMEKENTSLRYEVRILEKEADIRNEEREFNCRTAESTHKQHLENVKKIAKLESECQRLRVLVKKRLPGPAALAKMKTEVGMIRESADNRRRKSYSNASNLQLDYVAENYPDSPRKNNNLLKERICTLENENHYLRETLQKHLNELQVSRNMYVQTATKLSQVEAQLEVLPKDYTNRNIRSSRMSYDQSLASMSDIGSDDKVSCAGSWASALVSEQEPFRRGKDKVVSPSKSVAMSDINHFMDDFAEMEKLALVCVDKPIEASSVFKSESKLNSFSESTGKELVPVTSITESISSRLSKSISKLIEIVEGINLPSEDFVHSKTPSGTSYFSRVLQWRTSELATVLHNFLHSCNDLVNGKADFETFTQELTSALEWILNHCFSLQDVCSMKDAVKKQLGWDEIRSESETDGSIFGQIPEAAKLSSVQEQLVLDSLKQEEDVQSETHDSASIRNQLENSRSTEASLQLELEALKQSKDAIENQFESYVMTIEDLKVQLLAVKTEMYEAHKKFSALEGELKDKMKHCKELEAKCLDLQGQLERALKINTSEQVNQDKKQLQTEWEISAASEKLAECQETILHLGEQLKTLASSRDVVVSDKFISTPNAASVYVSVATPTHIKELTSQRSSLLDQMQAEDNAGTDQLESPKTKEIISANNFGSEQSREYTTENSARKNLNDTAFGSLATVPGKKQHTTSSGLFKKLLWRKRKSSSKKLQLPFAA